MSASTSVSPWLARLGALLAVVLVAVLAPAGPGRAAAPSYVALGDSYSSGTGTRTYLADGSGCLRSVYAYPSLIAAARGYALDFRACSGATIADVTAAQLSAVTPATSYVTISVGGNDAGFADVLTECALPWWAANCNGAIDGAQSIINNQLPSRLSTLYAAIRTRAPSAKVVVVGYPRIFMGVDCNAGTWFTSAEMTRLNQTADLLNSRLSAAAAARGFTFANPTSRFVGHAVCGSPEWINGLSWPISESYHPNRAGHSSGYTPTVSPVLTGATVTVTRATLTAAAGEADTLTAQQRQYAAQDAAITPQEFVAPDVTAPGMRRLARNHGVVYDRWLARQ
jgi:lysophospholipase L1-like esterase